MKSFFNKKLITAIAAQIDAVHPEFDSPLFCTQAAKGLSNLELKARSKHIALALAAQLPAGNQTQFKQSISILLTSMGTPDDNGGMEGMGGFGYLPHLDYLELHGLPYPKIALPAMAKMTRFFSAEFAIRPYIIKHPELTRISLSKWMKDKDWRVRRLASEGTRPRLPWGQQLPDFIRDPQPVLAILAQLFNDENLIVRRSVANNLNDIAKDHPDLAADTAQQWLSSNGEHASWTAKHGMRTLVKQGHPKALSVLGFTGGEQVEINKLTLSPAQLSIGDQISIAFELLSNESDDAKLVVDYALERVLANGKLARKVFKIGNKILQSGERMSIDKKHNFRQRSTRTYYPGQHAIEIVVNGHIKARKTFVLKAPASQR